MCRPERSGRTHATWVNPDDLTGLCGARSVPRLTGWGAGAAPHFPGDAGAPQDHLDSIGVFAPGAQCLSHRVEVGTLAAPDSTATP